MLKVGIKNIKFSYLNYFNKLVLNKNLYYCFSKYNSSKHNILIKINKKKRNAHIVTLRAPKHFKVGRHHYHTISNYFFLLLKNIKKNIYIYQFMLYRYIPSIVKLIENKKVSKTLSLLTCVRVTFKIFDKFYIV